MVKIYYRLIVNSKMTIAGVPAKWKDAVREMLIENGVEFEEEVVEETPAEETEETTTTMESAEEGSETETTETSETVE